jgi:hypothetical protein
MTCERCGLPGAEIAGEVTLCETCLVQILREWKIRHEEFGALTG